MIQFLNNILTFFNFDVTDIIYFLIAGSIENYLFLTLLLLIFNVKASKKQKILYVILTICISKITSEFVPSPFNVIINYSCTILMLIFIFKIGILKSLTSLILTSFAFGTLNTLLQNPYLTILDIPFETFMNTPKYRIPYLIILYTSLLILIIFLNKSRKIKFRLDLLDSLDRKTVTLIILNLIAGFLTLCIQLIITTYYIDIVPLTITLLNFILLLSFLSLCFHGFNRIINLTITRKDLECAEEYNKSLEILYDEVKGFKHDFNNIVYYLDGYIENDDMNGLKEYFNEMKKDCKITNNLSLLNPRIINNPGIYSLLNNKYFEATNSGITFDIEFFLNLDSLKVNMYQFSRILGILIDNAIEATEKCDEKIIKISFIRENINSRAIVTITNTYSNKDVDIEKIFDKGLSSKANHLGVGLWEVKKYIKKSQNLDLHTSKTDKYFKQELIIYDL